MNNCMDPCGTIHNHPCAQEPDCGCEAQPMTVTLRGRIIQVCSCWLLVCDLCTGQQVRVNTDQACCYRVGECISVEYNGVMTTSIPPQISADSICRISCC